MAAQSLIITTTQQGNIITNLGSIYHSLYFLTSGSFFLKKSSCGEPHQGGRFSIANRFFIAIVDGNSDHLAILNSE